jgi:HD superfamily phosphohydrolase
MNSHKRTYLDPVHQDIVLDGNIPEEKLIIDLIDTKEFQRLRRIQQLGVTSYTFQGAEGSRFTHSIGAMYVAYKFLNSLAAQKNKIDKYKPLILVSALLHDLGHGPFSHVTEKIINYHHEDWSCRIIAGDTEVRKILDAYRAFPNLAQNVVQVLQKKYTPKYVSQLISSQLDCDRCDYLLRDSYMTGTAYGQFALPRIASAMAVDEKADRIVIVGTKGQTAVEDYLFARYAMYVQVYSHKKNLAARGHLASIVKRAKFAWQANQNNCFMDETMQAWLFNSNNLTVDQYLLLDDVLLMYHIKRWCEAKDTILADLSNRFLNRHLFKAKKIHSSDTAYIEELKKAAGQIALKKGLDPDYYVAIESTDFRPYEYDPDSAQQQASIMILTEDGKVQDLSAISLPIGAMVKGNYKSFWLVFAAEIADEIDTIVLSKASVR